MMTESIVGFFEGKRPVGILNPEVWDRRRAHDDGQHGG
jgi:hypothetical protein